MNNGSSGSLLFFATLAALATYLVGATLAALAAYLVGAIPFGYLITYWVKGIDIRTVGSGNLGATNVGRTLGFRYFVLVFVLDMLKGFLPTLGLPPLVESLTGSRMPDLPVLVALAAILGHTFPVYLKFRGGKGVATSVGTVLALDPISCGAAVLVFAVLLPLSKYVSLASLGGGLAFAAAHFARGGLPFSREHIAMTLFSIAVLVLLFVRHRGNLARIWAGTERKVNFRTHESKSDNEDQPRGKSDEEALSRGKVVVLVPVVLAVFALVVVGGVQIYRQANEQVTVNAGPWILRETDRANTGQQRVDHVAFALEGRRLAATCPRYERLVVYRVERGGTLTLIREVELQGRPVAVAAVGNRFVVLETPSGDQRHVQPGWWESFDSDGNHVGGRHPAGYYPDDLAVTPDGKRLLLLSSGRAEGDPAKPPPALEVIEFNCDADSARTVGRVTFDATDDPCRLSLSASGQFAAVLVTRTDQTLAIDLSDIESPLLIGRTKSTGVDMPYVSYSADSDWIIMPVPSQSEGIALTASQAGLQGGSASGAGSTHPVAYLVCTRQRDSVLDVVLQSEPLQSLGSLPLKGPLNMGRTRPTGLAYTPERGLLAVATRSGSIHMVEMIPLRDQAKSEREVIAVGRQNMPSRR